ncbi:hypothetical protein MLD38_028305 [Melastoma candidum]|uniref:Uncharacterized protein n=1 Tax=Melastoma candidum TaxID=119954 RepID=A0ACB9N1Z6_9MYRT|nr:hypothetical protein MLD38_028305 [Melastoma candidum]
MQSCGVMGDAGERSGQPERPVIADKSSVGARCVEDRPELSNLLLMLSSLSRSSELLDQPVSPEKVVFYITRGTQTPIASRTKIRSSFDYL